MSAVGVTAILYDHILTLADEICLIWFSPEAGTGKRIGFMLNRYTTEAMLVYVAYMLGGITPGLTLQNCRTFFWVFGVVACVSIATQQFIMVVRIYTIWDRRKQIRWIVTAAFAIQTSLTTAFAILAAYQTQPLIVAGFNMCGMTGKAWGLPVTLGTLTIFQLFMIIMTFFNALDRPHQKQADVVTSLIHDGAWMFFVRLLSTVNFVMSIVGDPSNCLVTLAFIWAMYGIVHSKMELRVEGLRMHRFTLPSNNALELHRIGAGI
ncbi:hypothetical protein DFH09DRAFT_1178281 [Mycena vulgaris]|nr:hypothetical protein DFH09DRAFT_1178281 [Mycena vulgaris]